MIQAVYRARVVIKPILGWLQQLGEILLKPAIIKHILLSVTRWLYLLSLCVQHTNCYFYKLSSEVQGLLQSSRRFEIHKSTYQFPFYTKLQQFSIPQLYYVQKIGPKLITLIFLVRYKTINFEGRMTDFTYLCSQSFLSTTWQSCSSSSILLTSSPSSSISTSPFKDEVAKS